MPKSSAVKSIPAFMVGFILRGQTRNDVVERYTLDAGIGIDVWEAFAANVDAKPRVLVSPTQGVTGMKLASVVHGSIKTWHRSPHSTPATQVRPGVSPMDNYVAVTLGWDELLRAVLPLTEWWSKNQFPLLQRNSPALQVHLRDAFTARFSGGDLSRRPAPRQSAIGEPSLHRRYIDIAPVAALIGTIEANRTTKSKKWTLPKHESDVADWIVLNSNELASATCRLLASEMPPVDPAVAMASASSRMTFSEYMKLEAQPALISRVFMDRKASLADSGAVRTIKSDAAARLFDVSCSSLTWALIDSGIAANHPAFFDHMAKDAKGNKLANPPSRVKDAFDFTRLDLIRNYDLTSNPANSPERLGDIEETIDKIVRTPGLADTPELRRIARKNLELIAVGLDNGLAPDWALIEPLIRVGLSDGDELVSDHGTHVAGVLGADWRSEDGSPFLQGVCPDIRLLDMRVISDVSEESTESAVLSALEYIRYLNQKAAIQELVVAGVNVSLSVPYDPKMYGCGATPVCSACDKLSDSGVVVVAAAGNRGWNAQEMGFSNYSFCSITDPGNAHKVITVGSTHGVKPHLYGVSYFSSRGPTGDGRLKPDLVAPGEKINGPVRGNANDERDGTSFAAPFVSGAAAMLISRHKELLGDPERVKEILCSTATDLGRERYFQGHGLVDVLRALQSV